MKNKIAILIFIGFLPANLKSQNDFIRSLVFTIQTAVDSTHEIIRCPKITIFSTRESFRGDSMGYYQMQLLKTDSIRITVMGYYPKTVKVKTLWESQLNVIYLLPFTYLLPEVRVGKIGEPPTFNLHLPKDIKLGKGSDVPMRLRPSGLGNISSNPFEILANPIGIFTYLLNDAEQQKRKVLELIKSEIHKEKREYLYMNRQVIEEISGFGGDSLQRFIVQCNTMITISPSDNILDVRQRIKWLADNYRKK